jgi:DNA/RNA-binding domain of Phe-tRNA-synthetase-like protein
MSEELELRAAPGFIEPTLRDEFPALRLSWISVEAGPRPSPRAIKHRLRLLSNRYHGASVIAMRTQPVPHAYRSFFRQIGLDPDLVRIPSEEAAVGRLLQGGFKSTNVVSDALLIALVETGVPVWALDADRVDASGLGIRTTLEGDRFGAAEHALPAGRLVVADEENVHALLFGQVAPGHGVGSDTKRVAAFSVAVEGVPEIHVEEALWICADVMRSAGA